MARKKDTLSRRKSNARTSLRRSKRAGDPMAAYDRLPPDLRVWLAQAALPWSPRSVLRVWRSALKSCGNDSAAAQSYLSHLELIKLRKDAEKIWDTG